MGDFTLGTGLFECSWKGARLEYGPYCMGLRLRHQVSYIEVRHLHASSVFMTYLKILSSKAHLRTMFVSECGNEPFIYVTIDNGMCSVALKREVNDSKYSLLIEFLIWPRVILGLKDFKFKFILESYSSFESDQWGWLWFQRWEYFHFWNSHAFWTSWLFWFFPFSIHFTRMGFPILLSDWLVLEVSLIGGRLRDKQWLRNLSRSYSRGSWFDGSGYYLGFQIDHSKYNGCFAIDFAL